jgi:hypothetical protein
VSLGAGWAFSVQPVLPSVWRPVVLLLTERHRAEDFAQRFRIRAHTLLQLDLAGSSNMQYQLLRSPRSSPMVSVCRGIFLPRFVATVC